MAKDIFNVKQIEDFFHGLLYGSEKLTDNLYFDHLPDGIEREVNHMTLVDISDSIQDLGGCAKGKIAIYNYVNPDSDVNIDDVDKKLNELIKNSKNEHYFITRDSIYSDFDYERGLDCNITIVNLFIV